MFRHSSASNSRGSYVPTAATGCCARPARAPAPITAPAATERATKRRSALPIEGEPDFLVRAEERFDLRREVGRVLAAHRPADEVRHLVHLVLLHAQPGQLGHRESEA